MNMSLKDVIQINQNLQFMPKLPIKASYRIGRFKSLTQPEVKEFVKTRDEMFEGFGLKKDSAGNWDIPSERKTAVDEQVEVLMSVETKISLDLIPLSWLEKVEIEPELMSIMHPMFDDKEDKK